jgi:hypothetical protein
MSLSLPGSVPGHSATEGTGGLAQICLRPFRVRFPGIQRLKARVDLLRHVFVTSGSHAFSDCRHGWTCSDIGMYLRHFRFPDTQRPQAQWPCSDICMYLCHFRSQAFSAWRHSWTCSDMSSSLPVPKIQRLKARVDLLGYVFVTSGSQAFSD